MRERKHERNFSNAGKLMSYVTLFMALFMALSVTAMAAPKHLRLQRNDWSPDVKQAVNDFLDMYGVDSPAYGAKPYVVFDFDNTTSIFDVEEQLMVYQVENMMFGVTPKQMPDILKTGLGDLKKDRTDIEAGYGKGSYQDRIDDISVAYEYLYNTYGPFTKYAPFTATVMPASVKNAMKNDPWWMEFATKMCMLYNLVGDNESASVSYPWVTYWQTGMTDNQNYLVALGSHTYYSKQPTSTITWTSPAEIPSKSGVCSVEKTIGVSVSQNNVELMRALRDNGIDVWVCSASPMATVIAAADAFGLHDYITGVTAMTNKMNSAGIYVNQYDYVNGQAYFPQADGSWVRSGPATKAQPQAFGKVQTIRNAIWPRYGYGPIAGFMDSTGDFNFCTEFASLKLVIDYNRANRKVTDGGGLIAAVAMYQKYFLNQNLAAANAAGDTLYVLQGREENGMRGLRASNYTRRYGSSAEKLFANSDNELQLATMVNNKMSVKDAINAFALKRSADSPKNILGGVKYGFCETYNGYHNIK